MKVLILGVNGFIGNSLTYKIMTDTDWEVYGMDMACDKLEHSINNPRFHFVEGDISINKEWIEYHIKKSDLVLPLVAIATPASYVQDPLAVFELDFEENLRIVRQCVKYKKRVIFPSTSEVYGMCSDPEFDPDTSPLVLGPIHKERWIYSCSKQLMDRVIWAYGREGLQFTLIRPFNWIGPKLDRITVGKEGSSRVLTQFLGNIMIGEPIKLVDGGRQSRSFTYIDDGINCLLKIIENKNNVCQGEIFNIGNPANNISIRDLAHTLREMVMQYPRYREKAEAAQIIEVTSEDYYGKGYQDIMTRVPSIKKAHELLGWKPKVNLKTALKKTLDYYLTEDHKETIL
ncbi:MAG: NAD-dependent epimerase/dehydratase family protein [Nitrospirae bacterium CG_4_10_14_3_um_filter_53_41]|nr:MAG: NAD-dependent epimerase/dehydratase family protein [Nitrospirae bacterium CG_4_10_14_3_um_filter_53_41]